MIKQPLLLNLDYMLFKIQINDNERRYYRYIISTTKRIDVFEQRPRKANSTRNIFIIVHIADNNLERTTENLIESIKNRSYHQLYSLIVAFEKRF